VKLLHRFKSCFKIFKDRPATIEMHGMTFQVRVELKLAFSSTMHYVSIVSFQSSRIGFWSSMYILQLVYFLYNSHRKDFVIS
jgi:hypothetical protein